MNYIKEFTKYDKLVRDDIYHKKIGAQNILFIGALVDLLFIPFYLKKYVSIYHILFTGNLDLGQLSSILLIY